MPCISVDVNDKLQFHDVLWNDYALYCDQVKLYKLGLIAVHTKFILYAVTNT